MNAGRGEVWTYVAGSRQYHVVIITADEFNESNSPWALVIRRDARPPASDLVIYLNGDDPAPGGCVLVGQVLRCIPTGLRESLGFLSHPTMTAVERSVRLLLEHS